ncbi:MAG: pyridoxal phosphate-dependent aminotransferase [Paracoccaceae bacterium]
MQASARIRAIHAGGGHGWEILERARAMRRAGRAVIDLTIGEHEAPTPAPIVEAMAASARAGNTRYAAVTGTPELRAAVAARVASRTGAPCTPEEIAVTVGGQMALSYAFHACLDPGDAAVILDPFYPPYPGTLHAAGARVRVAPSLPDDGFQPDLEALDRACEGARALLINTPHNPTGAVYRPETIEALAEIARRRNLWLISDEVYDGMVWSGTHRSPRALPGMAERTVVIGSLSKSHAMTGFRLGWAVAPAPLARLMGDLALNLAYGLPGFVQDAGLFALTRAGAAEGALRETFRRRRDVAAAALAGHDAVRLSAPDGAMYVMLDIRATGIDGRTFAAALLDAEGVAVMPGESFGASAAGHLRVALTAPDEALADALRRIARFAETRRAPP